MGEKRTYILFVILIVPDPSSWSSVPVLEQPRSLLRESTVISVLFG